MVRPLALSVCLSLFSLTSVALAAPPVAMHPASVPSGSQTTVYVVAVDDVGGPVDDLRLRPAASLGELSDWRAVGDGLYAATYTAPTVGMPTDVTLTLRGRGADREMVELARDVTVQPVPSTEMSVTVNPARLTLGDDTESAITLRLPGTARPAAGASFGELQGLTPTEGGQWTAQYQPRDVNFPHVAVVGVVDERGGQAAAAPIALSGKVGFPVAAPAGSTVSLRIAGDEFGPVTADAGGAALVPIVVPPGVTIATLVISNGGQVTESALDLGIPGSRRVSLLPMPPSIPAGGSAMVYASVVEPTGEMDPVTLPEITATSGSVGEVRRVGPGLVGAEWTAGEASEEPVSVLVTIPGETDQAHAVDVRVLDGRPASIEVVHDPIEGSGALPVEVIVRNADDVATSGFDVRVAGGDPVELSDGGRGSYRGVAQLTPATMDQLVTVATAPTGLPPANVAFTVPRYAVSPNGALPVGVVVLDRYGVPVPETVVELEVVEGGGRIERTVATDAAGVAMARYRSPESTGTVRIVATSGDLRSELVLAQVPVTDQVELPPLASDDPAAQWRQSASWLGAPPPEIAVVQAPEDEPAAEPTPEEEPPRPPPEGPPPRQHETLVRLRGSAVFSTYTYVQDPIGDGGPLLDKAVVVGTDNGNGAATPIGVEVSGRAFAGLFPYVGVAAKYRSTWYGITAPEFEGAVANDALQYVHVAAVGRLPILFGRDGIAHVGLRIGGEYSDFIYFTGDVEARFIEFTTLAVPALAIGGEIGIELGPVYGLASYDGGLAFGTDPFSGRLDLEAGVDVVDNVFLSLGGGHVARERTITGNTSGSELGTVTDRQWYGQLGLGIRL